MNKTNAGHLFPLWTHNGFQEQRSIFCHGRLQCLSWKIAIRSSQQIRIMKKTGVFITIGIASIAITALVNFSVLLMKWSNKYSICVDVFHEQIICIHHYLYRCHADIQLSDRSKITTLAMITFSTIPTTAVPGTTEVPTKIMAMSPSKNPDSPSVASFRLSARMVESVEFTTPIESHSESTETANDYGDYWWTGWNLGRRMKWIE